MKPAPAGRRQSRRHEDNTMSETAEFAPVHLQRWQRSENYRGTDWSDWYMVASRTRDSGPLDVSNFETAWNRLRHLVGGATVPDPDYPGHETSVLTIPLFRTWGPGWSKVLMLHKDAPIAALEEAEKMRNALTRYPVLDERDFTEREEEKINETWNSFSLDERKRWLRQCNLPTTQARYRFSKQPDDEGLLRAMLLE
jgi:hypothetical protein